MNEIQRNVAALDEMFVAEILKAKTRFVHACLAAILPPELYKLAAADNQRELWEGWARAQGYYWSERKGQTALMKGPLLVGLFQPALVGEGESRRCVFLAQVNGMPVNVAENNPLLN